MAKRIDIDLLRAYDKELRTRAMILQRSFEYSLDDVVRWGNIKLKCTTAGKTNTTSIVLTDKVVGDTVTDGTCVWELVDPNAGGGGTSGGSERVLSRKHLYDESTFNTASKTISLSAINTYKYLSVTYEVTDDTNTYSNTALIETSESGEHLLTIYVDNNNFAVLGAEISANDLIITSYQVANLSKYRILSIDGIKEIYAGGGGGGINRWKANGNYKLDDVVLCSSEVNTNEWIGDTSYAVDDIVVYGSLVFNCITANTDTTFDIDKWELVREVYTVVYRCITDNNDSTFDEVKWEQIGGSGNTDIEGLFA